MSITLVEHYLGNWKVTKLPPVSFLRECFIYHPKTGNLTWNVDRPVAHFGNNRGHAVYLSRYAGHEVGREGQGYRQVMLCGVNYLVHRLIWKLMTSKDPGKLQVDHRDLNGLNNAWKNLRLASHSQNRLNSSTPRNNTSGAKNVFPTGGKHHKWKVLLRLNGRLETIGRFCEKSEAIAAATKARKKYHHEFANHG